MKSTVKKIVAKGLQEVEVEFPWKYQNLLYRRKSQCFTVATTSTQTAVLLNTFAEVIAVETKLLIPQTSPRQALTHFNPFRS